MTVSSPVIQADPAQPPNSLPSGRRGRRHRHTFERPRGLWVVYVVVVIFLFAPIVAVVAYSFNGTSSLSVLRGFSLRWYSKALTDPDLRASFIMSVLVAAVSAIAAAVLGTALAIGASRTWKWLALTANSAVAVRLLAPETATAVALFLLFGLTGIPLSFTSLLIAHAALSIAFVMVIVRSRLVAIGHEIEDAAADLGASPVTALWLVVVPELLPAVAAAGMVSFVLSFDDFVTSFFTSGIGTTPLPVLIYSMMRFGVTPVVNAIGVIMLVVSAAGMVGALLIMRRMRRPAS